MTSRLMFTSIGTAIFHYKKTHIPFPHSTSFCPKQTLTSARIMCAIPMLAVTTLKDHTSVVVARDTLEMARNAQVKIKVLNFAFCTTTFLCNTFLPNCTPTDVNECETNNGECTQVCTNSDASFSCSCKEGFFLQDDQKTCKGK